MAERPIVLPPVWQGEYRVIDDLSKQARHCHDRAVIAEHDATQTVDPALCQELLNSATRWRKLARSYEFTEELQCYLYRPTKADNRKR
jgi:hypothetical protein